MLLRAARGLCPFRIQSYFRTNNAGQRFQDGTRRRVKLRVTDCVYSKLRVNMFSQTYGGPLLLHGNCNPCDFLSVCT